MRLRYTPEAIRDLQETSRYISDVLRNPTAAIHFSRQILRRCAALKDFPEMGASIQALTGHETALRMMTCKSHVVLYQIDVDTVSVLRVIHTRRDYLRVLFGDTLSEEPPEP